MCSPTLLILGPSRILFGTDSSFFPAAGGRDLQVSGNACSPRRGSADRQRMFGGNFSQVFMSTHHTICRAPVPCCVRRPGGVPSVSRPGRRRLCRRHWCSTTERLSRSMPRARSAGDRRGDAHRRRRRPTPISPGTSAPATQVIDLRGQLAIPGSSRATATSWSSAQQADLD